MIISNSDITSFQKCEKRFYYERVLELRPLEYPAPMEDGTFGHTMMEVFFGVIKAGGSFEEASQETGKLLLEVMDSPSKMKIYKHVLAFGAYFLNQPWRIVEIEDKGSFPVTDQTEFGFTPDLVIEWTKGPLRDQQAVMDYKFTGQRWNDRQINTFQQIPKYIIYKNLRDGTNIRRGGIVQLNTRADASATGDKLFHIAWVPITKKKLETIQRENEILMERVRPYFENPEEHEFLHTVDSYQCKMCFFADDLCPMEMQGKDVTRIIERNYKKNDYGYDKKSAV